MNKFYLIKLSETRWKLKQPISTTRIMVPSNYDQLDRIAQTMKIGEKREVDFNEL